MTLSDGYAVMPEQSTVAIVAHHPQAVYFGMKSGFIPEEQAPDELIAGTERGGRCRRRPSPDSETARAWSEGRAVLPVRRRTQAVDALGASRLRRRAAAWLEPNRRSREGLHAQVAPGEALADQRGQAERDRGGDLDRLQDHPVGERVGGADPRSRCAGR